MTALRRINPLYVVAGVLTIAAVVFAIVTAGSGATTTGRTASVYDDGPGGAAALRHAIERVGGTTKTLQGDVFAIGSDTGVVFILGATEIVTPQDVAVVRAYLRSGGTVVVASDLGVLERPLLDVFGIGYAGASADGPHRLGGAFLDPPAAEIAFDRGGTLSLGGTALPLASDGRGTIVALAPEGRGLLVVVASLWPFLAEGLADADNGRFALGLASIALGARRDIAFDEYHHGLHPSADFMVLIERTWPGRALLFAAAALFLYLIATGRRFGVALPLDPRPPRSSLEYVRGFAGLVRRSGRGEVARRRLRRELQTGLARAAGLDPATPFERTLASIAASDPRRAAEARAADDALAHALRDDALLRTVGQIERLLRNNDART